MKGFSPPWLVQDRESDFLIFFFLLLLLLPSSASREGKCAMQVIGCGGSVIPMPNHVNLNQSDIVYLTVFTIFELYTFSILYTVLRLLSFDTSSCSGLLFHHLFLQILQCNFFWHNHLGRLWATTSFSLSRLCISERFIEMWCFVILVSFCFVLIFVPLQCSKLIWYTWRCLATKGLFVLLWQRGIWDGWLQFTAGMSSSPFVCLGILYHIYMSLCWDHWSAKPKICETVPFLNLYQHASENPFNHVAGQRSFNSGAHQLLLTGSSGTYELPYLLHFLEAP